MQLRSQDGDTEESLTKNVRRTGGRGNSRFRAYNITAEQDAAEIEKNLGRPTSDFLLSGEDSLEEQELKLSFIIV